MRTLAWCALLTATLSAQEFTWNLPGRGAARYERVLTHTGAATQKPENWRAWRSAGLVLAGELDADGRHFAEPWVDLRDLVARACLDAGRLDAGTSRLDFAGSRDHAPFALEVEYSPVDEDGAQQLRWTVRAVPPRDRKAPPRARVAGAGAGERTLDRERGLVTGLSGHAELRVTAPGGADEPFVLDDAWTLRDVLQPEFAEFRAAVQHGIDDAVESLQQSIRQRLGAGPGATDLDGGELALVLLALVKGTRDRDDALLLQGYDELRTRQLTSTYSLAVALLALEGLYAPPDEWQRLRDGALLEPAPRAPSARDEALLELWTQQLLRNVDESVDRARTRRWHYGPSKSWDNSNCGYAALGLFAAGLCGVAIDEEVWAAATRHWLDTAQTTGFKGAPQVVTHALAAAADDDRRRGTASRIAEVGWGYGPGDPITGSMTSGAVAAMLMYRDHVTDRRLRRGLDDAIRGGMLWLQRNLSVRHNPGPAAGLDEWPYYWLFGVERCCELQQVLLLGERDWYFDGALQLLGLQHDNGSWGDERDTCFALLFLKKAALPVTTRR
ncbi:MAG: hypothetical protein AB7O97_17360 [Planctomycetota bacterium]